MGSNCIVVPVYKPFNALTSHELLSLKQLYTILGSHSIYFIGPASLNFTAYVDDAKINGVVTKVKEFEDLFFSDLVGYNRLLISNRFYNAFRNYNYLLIYQTDAFVFRDELDHWCKMGYDFIGAPWFKGFAENPDTNEIIGVGNGGFSLRNIANSIRLINRVNFLKILYKIWVKSRIQHIYNFDKFILKFKKYFKTGGSRNPSDTFVIVDEINEDYFWSQIIGVVFTDYKVAPVDEAIKFSFEVNPSLLFELNNHQLPFGCHAMHKYEPEFWDQYLHSIKTPH